MSGRRNFPIVAIFLIASTLCFACRKSDKPSPTAAAPVEPTDKENEAQSPQETAKVSGAPTLDSKSTEASTKDSSALPELSRLWGAMKKQKLGPAAPATATEAGVFFVTRDDRLLFARFDDDGRLTPITEPSKSFNQFGRGPSVSPTHAYWSSEKGQLMSGSLSSLKTTEIHPHARSQSRTSTLHYKGHDLVAFIKEVDNAAMAHVWVGRPGKKGTVLRLSPEGSGATSVAIVHGSPHPRVIVLAGRTGMSPLHLREVRVTDKAATLGEDEVVWVGPGSHPLTEIHALEGNEGRALAFLATAKDFSDFGLAQLAIDAQGGEIKQPGWRLYPNGLDPAPVAAAKICGDGYLLYARPTEARPYAPQALHLAQIRGDTPGEGEIIARARAFRDLSLVRKEEGAVAVWTAGGGSWAMELSCPVAQ